jgi:hypothetical protein
MTSLIRAIIAQGAARIERSSAADYAAGRWPGDTSVPLMLRAASAPTLMANATALTPVTQQFVEQLAPLSASGALANAGGLVLTSFGRGLVSVPSFAPGESAFVAEGAAIPVKQFVASGPTLSPYKLATIVTLSGELFEHSQAEMLLRAALTESVALGLDRKLFSADAAVAATSPAGLLNGIAALTATAAGAGAMAGDLNKILTAIAPVAGAGFFVVAAPAQATALQIGFAREIPNVMASAALTAGTVIAVASRAFVSIFETPRIDTAFEALVHEDTAATAISTAGAIAAPTRSLFQTNSVGLRMITPCSWALRATGAVAWVQSVNW